MDIASINKQISETQRRITKLQLEMADQRRFKHDINKDAIAFERQLQIKKGKAVQAGAIANTKAAKAFSKKSKNALGSTFKTNVKGCFGKVSAQVDKTIEKHEKEIAEQKRHLTALKKQLAAAQTQQTSQSS
jgi:uncharacterized coiled-coil protein SlyX